VKQGFELRDARWRRFVELRFTLARRLVNTVQHQPMQVDVQVETYSCVL